MNLLFRIAGIFFVLFFVDFHSSPVSWILVGAKRFNRKTFNSLCVTFTFISCLISFQCSFSIFDKQESCFFFFVFISKDFWYMMELKNIWLRIKLLNDNHGGKKCYGGEKTVNVRKPIQINYKRNKMRLYSDENCMKIMRIAQLRSLGFFFFYFVLSVSDTYIMYNIMLNVTQCSSTVMLLKKLSFRKWSFLFGTKFSWLFFLRKCSNCLTHWDITTK